MLYKKNDTKKLDLELFRDPTSEYRGAPFWAWNCKLDQKELEWQLEILKKMGLGGAHMHVRSGMETPYLSDEYMELIKACVQKAKEEKMYAWLYDEDRWPSGAAGGLVTKDRKYSARYLLFTPFPYGSVELKEKQLFRCAQGGRNEEGILLACYDVKLDQDGYLIDWRIIEETEQAVHEKWYAYLEICSESPWFNNETYVNTLDKAAMDRFIEITYEAYSRTISEEFNKTVPAIFTDEPQFVEKSTLRYATEKADVVLPWTDDLAETYAKCYQGENLIEGIPELIWDRADRAPSIYRYHYHDHVCERFSQAFVDNCGKWCREHNIQLTGHMMNEGSLWGQTSSLGEAMRAYRSMGIPGIDMVCAWFEYPTAKQTQSAVRQFGKEAMLSELYGVTNWDFDFRGHKLHGDWQAALGVNVRVHHLSWVSMAGEAKRDYPASIHYQSPWYLKYSLVEDHFARLNTALTRGKPIVKVGVIHPIESYWLHWGPEEQTALVRQSLEENFQNLTKWLLFGGIDFDFISESLFPELCDEATTPLKVGAMEYDAIIVPGCETLRSTTYERLEAFQEAGGKLIFIGKPPMLEDACSSNRGMKLAEKASCIECDRGVILSALESQRLVEFRDQTGALTNNLLHQLRKDGDGQWLFIAHGVEPYNKHISNHQDLRIRIKGKWKAQIYNTQNGEIDDINQSICDNCTELSYRMYDYDSLLVWLEPATEEDTTFRQKTDGQNMDGSKIAVPRTVAYTLSEPNVLLLDCAQYALDDGDWQTEEEIIRIDDICREQMGWPSRRTVVAQPWAVEKEAVCHTVHLRWHIFSDIEYSGAQLAIEDAEVLSLRWNGNDISNKVTGWYVDKSIKTIEIPTIVIGENVLEADIPFAKHTNVEWAYLLGDFGVEVCGRNARIIPKKKELAFGNITTQGLPFYGGNITYHIPIETSEGKVRLRSGYYIGAMQEASMDTGKTISMIYPPYTAEIGDVDAGKHTIHLTFYGHRRNSFGPVHLADLKHKWIGPGVWHSSGERWCYEYMISEEGIMVAPEIMLLKRNETV